MFLTKRFLILLTATVVLTAMGVLWPIFYSIGTGAIVILLLAFLVDLFSVFSKDSDIECERIMSERFSNGDSNPITLVIKSLYSRPIDIKIIDEIPVEFQMRNFGLRTHILPKEEKKLIYNLIPQRRGEYLFEKIHLYVSSKWGLAERHFMEDTPARVKVFPSFLFIRNMELLSIENKTRECGIKQVRRIGSSTEFDQIKEYVIGDDYRMINWKATARKHQLMLNLYTDEQSQQVFNVIDKGRGMQHTFQDMSLLDYSINATLSLSYMVIQHRDNAGLITFERKVDTYIPASRKINQMELLMENLYKQSSTYIQSDYSTLYEWVRAKVNKRSLFIIYTTFDTNVSMERQLPYLRKLASNHVVLVVFFKDEELSAMAKKRPITDEEYFLHVTAENIEFEKRMIVKNLHRYGIQSLLCRPQDLRVNVINKYIDLKAHRVI
ncbi:MAG: DUF58 domain-containing protein [Paludibacteraceae bacterium]|nr:DUF58 domain-containing protein [Paludibacteraceae bacterium]